MKKSMNLFDDALEKSLARLSVRAQSIIKKRFGIGIDAPKTLDAIGKECDITRERVRQIVSTGIMQMNHAPCATYREAQRVLVHHVRAQGGIVHIDRLLQHFLQAHGTSPATMHFFIAASSEIALMKKHKTYPLVAAVHVSDFDFDVWHALHNDIETFLKDKNNVCTHDDLYAVIAEKYKHVDSAQAIEQLHVSRKVKQNSFGKWGLTQWRDVTPKNIRDKVYMILEHYQKPMHFRDIAQSIDAQHLNKGSRKTHPQTVHNELIKDDRFVLVGRGIYKLTTDNYVTGSVRSIITHILTEHDAPITIEEVIKRVLEHRLVKPSTIKINLQSVAKKEGDTYTLK